MKIATFSLVAAALVSSVVVAAELIDGYSYSYSTNKFVYSNFRTSGSYSDVTYMDEKSGLCLSLPILIDGPLKPLNEELSAHFRGPIKLKQFGVYYPSSNGVSKRDAGGLAKKGEVQCTLIEHHVHKHAKREVAQVTKTVVLDQHGNTVTPSNPAGGAATGAAAPGSDSSSSSGSGSSSSSATDGWVRVSYYTPGSTTNCTILNHKGGRGSGVWNSAFGNSISYANEDNTDGSPTPVALGDVSIGSNEEFLIMSGLLCGDNSETQDCGFYRSGIPAYHGWNGGEKIFVFEFEMPYSPGTGFNMDMPAIWLLNGKIPRTLQYGKASCSCWGTGCGELDLFEILSAGSNKMITALHAKLNGDGGSPNYINRPTLGSMKAVAIFTNEAIHVMRVDDSVSFDGVLSSSLVNEWVAVPGADITVH